MCLIVFFEKLKNAPPICSKVWHTRNIGVSRKGGSGKRGWQRRIVEKALVLRLPQICIEFAQMSHQTCREVSLSLPQSVTQWEARPKSFAALTKDILEPPYSAQTRTLNMLPTAATAVSAAQLAHVFQKYADFAMTSIVHCGGAHPTISPRPPLPEGATHKENPGVSAWPGIHFGCAQKVVCRQQQVLQLRSFTLPITVPN